MELEELELSDHLGADLAGVWRPVPSPLGVYVAARHLTSDAAGGQTSQGLIEHL